MFPWVGFISHQIPSEWLLRQPGDPSLIFINSSWEGTLAAVFIPVGGRIKRDWLTFLRVKQRWATCLKSESERWLRGRFSVFSPHWTNRVRNVVKCSLVSWPVQETGVFFGLSPLVWCHFLWASFVYRPYLLKQQLIKSSHNQNRAPLLHVLHGCVIRPI